MSDKVTPLITFLFQNAHGENEVGSLELVSYSETEPCLWEVTVTSCVYDQHMQ